MLIAAASEDPSWRTSLEIIRIGIPSLEEDRLAVASVRPIEHTDYQSARVDNPAVQRYRDVPPCWLPQGCSVSGPSQDLARIFTLSSQDELIREMACSLSMLAKVTSLCRKSDRSSKIGWIDL